MLSTSIFVIGDFRKTCSSSKQRTAITYTERGYMAALLRRFCLLTHRHERARALRGMRPNPFDRFTNIFTQMKNWIINRKISHYRRRRNGHLPSLKSMKTVCCLSITNNNIHTFMKMKSVKFPVLIWNNGTPCGSNLCPENINHKHWRKQISANNMITTSFTTRSLWIRII